MSDFNSTHNRLVWFDLPVANLDRAEKFYAAVMGVKVERQYYGDFVFSMFEHGEGNGGCLIVKSEEISAVGTLIYFNVDGRIRDAVSQVATLGGKVLQETHAIGPHGFRAVILDSEGNRIALHSTQNA